MSQAPIHTILMPTDASDEDLDAFRLACWLARDYDARLVVLHVLRPGPASTQFGRLVAPSPSEAEVRRRLGRFQASSPRLRVESMVRHGRTAEAILRAAEEVSSDLIVMGVRSRTALQRLLSGSITDMVRRRAPCPVLTVKPSTVRRGAGSGPRRVLQDSA